jgi:hypothetical protein
MKKGDLVYVAGNEYYTYTRRGSWGYFLKYFHGNYTARVHWKHFACDLMDKDHFLNGSNGSNVSDDWPIKTEHLRVLSDPPEDHNTITELVRVLTNLEGTQP